MSPIKLASRTEDDIVQFPGVELLHHWQVQPHLRGGNRERTEGQETHRQLTKGMLYNFYRRKTNFHLAIRNKRFFRGT
mgnify:CR=1 FL=1